jgi:hypothetical protein
MDMELKSIDMERDMSSWRERLRLALLEFVLPHSETWAEASERNERQMMVDFIVMLYWCWGCGFANECDVMRLEIEFYNGDPKLAHEVSRHTYFHNGTFSSFVLLMNSGTKIQTSTPDHSFRTAP